MNEKLSYQTILKIIKKQKYKNMTYRATLQIVITMNELYLFNLRKQGQVRFKMSLFQKEIGQDKKVKKKEEPGQQQPEIYCNPYNIARKCDIIKSAKQRSLPSSPSTLKPYNQFPQMNTFPYNQFKQSMIDPLQGQSTTSSQKPHKIQSSIDTEGQSYYSRVFDTKFAEQTHKIQQSVFFKCYVPVDLLNSTELMIKVELMYSPQQQNVLLSDNQMFKLLGCFKGKIRRLSPISSYLPISFDEFEGFTISATYHTTIMEFKFEQLEELQPQTVKNYEEFASFEHYLRAATSNCTNFLTIIVRRAQSKNFYFYYREFLEKELFDLQERHSDLIRVLNLTHLIDYRFIKVAPNSQIIGILNGLPIFANDKAIDRYTEGALISCLLQDFLQLKALIHQKWNNLVMFMTQYIQQVTQHYSLIYEKNLKQRFKGNVFSHRIQANHDWTFSKYQDSGKKYEEMAENDRKKKKEQELWSQLFPIEDKNCFDDQKTFIKMFQQVYTVRRDKKLMPAVKKFNLANFSKLQQNPHTFQGIVPVGKLKQHQQHYNLRQAKNQRPSISNIRKSSMVTLGQGDFSSQKQKHIELGHQTYHRSQSLKQKYEGSFAMGLNKMNTNVPVSQANKNDKGQHIIVLVHGYQASRQDFQVLKLCLEIRFKAKVFISNSNEGRTDDNVEAMGKRLAIELARYFQNLDFTPNTRISFIGHSLGGVIIRSALGFLHNISQYLYTYISFSSPHLGYLYEPSRLIKAGLWIMNSWQGSKCLNEICMKDSQDLRMSYFFRLSQNKALNGFKKIALISSSQDGYIPYESARIEKNSDILYNKLGDSISRNVILQMVDNILGQVEAQEISRINVIFHIQDKNMDSLIGRTAHIKYLSDLKFIKMFFIVFEKFFI